MSPRLLLLFLLAIASLAADRPELPAGAETRVWSKHYTIYELNGLERVLFDPRYAVTTDVLTGLRHTDETATDLYDGKIFILEGRHRAVAAARGYLVPHRLGGREHGWLDYLFRRNTLLYCVGGHFDGQVRLLTEIDEEWEGCRRQLQDPSQIEPPIE